MTIKLLIILAALFCGILLGWVLGIRYMIRKASDGIAMRADDGEVYLKISEAGQIKLSDPKTRLLYINVIDVHTRNNQSL